MQNENLNIVGKSAGEIARDFADFLSKTCIVQGRQEMDFANLLPDLNMKEQFSFALLMEARTQGWEPSAAENFYTRICAPLVGEGIASSMLEAFRAPDSELFASYTERYGASFGITSHAYWTSCLAVAIDAQQISRLMEYLRSFVLCIMEFAYMGDRNPETTYVWSYYESFQKILAELSSPTPAPEQIAVRALGGSSGSKAEDSYSLSLGIDLQNPNHKHMAWNVSIDITLKDQDGNVITVITDKVNCIDPAAVFHYGIVRRIKGKPVAHISATAHAESFTKLTTPVMKHILLSGVSMKKGESGATLSGKLDSRYDCSISSFALHYQLLNAQNKIIGGGSEWFFDSLEANGTKSFSAKLPVSFKNAAKVVYSVDFDARELI